MYFFLMICFSTCYSPGAGVDGLKELRHLFPRYYLWCMIPPPFGDEMEECPKNNTLLYLILSSLVVPFVMASWLAGKEVHTKVHREMKHVSQCEVINSSGNVIDLQLELFGRC